MHNNEHAVSRNRRMLREQGAKITKVCVLRGMCYMYYECTADKIGRIRAVILNTPIIPKH